MPCLLPAAEAQRGDEAATHETAMGGVRTMRDEVARHVATVTEHEGALHVQQVAVAQAVTDDADEVAAITQSWGTYERHTGLGGGALDGDDSAMEERDEAFVARMEELHATFTSTRADQASKRVGEEEDLARESERIEALASARRAIEEVLDAEAEMLKTEARIDKLEEVELKKLRELKNKREGSISKQLLAMKNKAGAVGKKVNASKAIITRMAGNGPSGVQRVLSGQLLSDVRGIGAQAVSPSPQNLQQIKRKLTEAKRHLDTANKAKSWGANAIKKLRSEAEEMAKAQKAALKLATGLNESPALAWLQDEPDPRDEFAEKMRGHARGIAQTLEDSGNEASGVEAQLRASLERWTQHGRVLVDASKVCRDTARRLQQATDESKRMKQREEAARRRDAERERRAAREARAAEQRRARRAAEGRYEARVSYESAVRWALPVAMLLTVLFFLFCCGYALWKIRKYSKQPGRRIVLFCQGAILTIRTPQGGAVTAARVVAIVEGGPAPRPIIIIVVKAAAAAAVVAARPRRAARLTPLTERWRRILASLGAI